jgi:hypothetical protein
LDNKKIEEQYGKKIESDNIFTDLYYDAVDIINDTVKPFMGRSFKTAGVCMSPENFLSIFKTKERYFYLASLPLSAFLIHKVDVRTGLSIKFYAFSFFGYFLYKGLYLEIFPDLKPKLLLTVKKKKDDELSSMSIEEKLMTVLRKYNFEPKFAGKSETDFIVIIKIRTEADIKSVMNKYLDIASRMKLNKEDLNIKIVKDTFHFEITKEKQPLYLFHEYLKKSLKRKKEMPFVLGVNQSTGQLVVEDLIEMQSMLVTGIPKSGKSCFINNFIQSSMFFKNHCLYILIDLKGNELNQYLGFKNCMFIKKNKHIEAIMALLLKEIEARYELLGTCKNLKDFNELNNMNIPYIAIVIDELAEISLGEESSKKLINNIVRIGNLGRACGVYLIGATQRPSHTQVATDGRAAFTTTVTGRVANKRDCGFTDSPGAEKLKAGEFLVNSFNYTLEKFKGLFIDDRNHNYIFDELKEKLTKVNLKKVIKSNLNSKERNKDNVIEFKKTK